MHQNGTQYLTARKVWERYGVTSMTLHRWVADESMSFPAPHYFGRLRFWNLAELEEWERSPRKAPKRQPGYRKPPKERTETPDSVVKCLYIVTQPTGARSFAYRYRVGEQTVKYTIGVANRDSQHKRSIPIVTLREARLIATALNDMVDRFSCPETMAA
jgi:predicted DNA-binding transcriptional regulator AlpA